MRLAVLTLVAASMLSACGGGAPSAGTPSPGAPAPGAPATAPSTLPGANEPGAATFFTVPAEQLPHLQIVKAATAEWQTTIRTTGTVDWDNDHTTQAITQVSGPITRLVVDTGAHVKAGDPLLYVASADITNAVAAYRKARNRLDLAQRTLTRSKDLLDHKAISQRDLESAQADFNDASTDLQTALQALKIYGVSQTDIAEAEQQGMPIKPELAMRAPIAGIIVQKMVLPGQFIQAGMTAAFVISNTATVWVQGHVYDKDLTSVHVGDKVDVRNASFPQLFHGVVANIGDFIDPATRTTAVRIVTANIGGLLKKDLFVDVVIHDKSSQKVLAVPTSAVLYDDENMPFVYIQAAPGKFAQRLVKVGGQQDNDTQIVDGLQPGDAVVSQGSVFLQFANTNQ
jgi:membrane fusion protein, heavy metal efflux system